MPRRCRIAILTATLVFLAVGRDAAAAVVTWTGASTVSNWDRTANWTSGLPAAADDVVFGSGFTSGTSIDLGGARTVNSLTIATGTSFRLLNDTLQITSGSLSRQDLSSGTQSIASAVTLGAGGNWAINGSGRVIVAGAIDEASLGFGLTKTGTGTLQLSGTNRFSGGFILSSGTVVISSTSALGTGSLTLAGGTLDIATAGGDVAYATGVTADATILSNLATGTAGITHTLGTLSIGSSVLTIGRGAAVTSGTAGIAFGATTLSGNASFTTGSGALLTLGGLSDGGVARTLTKSGSGGLTLRGAAGSISDGTVMNVAAGTLTLADAAALGSSVTSITMIGGTVALGAPTTLAGLTGTGGGIALGGNTLTVNTATSGTFAGGISGSGTLTKTGTGTLALSGATTFGGTVNVNQGTLASATSNTLSGSAAMVVAGGVFDVRTFNDSIGTFSITSGSLVGTSTLTAATYAFGGGTVASNLGAGTVSVTANTSLLGVSSAGTVDVASGTLTLGSAGRLVVQPNVTGSAGAVITLAGNESFNSLAGGVNVAVGSGTLTAGGLGATTVYAGSISGPGGFVKAGAGTMTLSGSNSYGGRTNVNGGRLLLGSSNAISGSTTVTILTGTFDIGAFSPTIVSGTQNGGTLAGSGTLTTTGTYTISSGTANANLGTGPLRTTGAASLGGSSAAGTLTVASGTLTLTAPGRFTAAPNVSLTTFTGIAFAGSETFGSLAGAGGTILLGGGTLTTGGSGSSTTFSGAITGTGGLVKVGSGTFTFSGTSTFTGPTSVTDGQLALGRPNVLPDTTTMSVTNAGLALGTLRDTVAAFATGNSGTATLAVTLTSGSAGILTTTGNVAFGSGSNVLAFTNVNTGTAGRYDVLTYGGTLSGTYGSSGVNGTNYTLQNGGTTNASIFLQRKAQFGTIATTVVGTNAIISGGTAAFTFTVTNTTPTGGANLTLSSASTGTNVFGTVNTGTIDLAPQATSGAVSGFSFTSNTTGTQTGQFTVTSPNAVLSTGTGSVTVSVYDHASPTLTSGTIAILPLHVGYAAVATGSIAAGNAAGFRVAMNGTGTASGAFGMSDLGGIAPGASGFITGTFAAGQTTGTYTQSVTYRFSDASSLSGASTSVGTANVLLSAQVYTGTSTWVPTTSGTHSWGTLTGTGARAFGLNWGTNQGSPGLDTAFTRTDTANFGTTLTGGTAVVLLNGANPSLKAITFNNAAGSYDLDVGTGGTGRIILAGSGTSAGTLDVLAGFHQIHTEFQLGSNVQVSVAPGSSLLLHSAITGGAYGLTKSGAGLLTMRGNDVYSGGTLITGGTLAIGSANSLGSGTVTLSNGSTLNLQGFAITNPIDSTGGFVINPASNVVTISGPTVVSGTSITGVYTVTPTGSGTFTGRLGDSLAQVGGQVTVQSGGLLTTTGTITDYGSVLILAGGRGIFSAAVNGVITSSGTSTFAADLLPLADVTVNGGVATFNGTSYGDVNVDVSGTNTGGATATFNGTIDRTAHVYASGTMNLYGSVTANADVKVEAGGLARLYGSGTFGQGAMLVNGSFVLDRTADLTMATVLSGTGNLVKQGNWLLTLTGSSNYAGVTSVNAGALAINGHLGSGTVAVANGAILSGAGVAGLTITGDGQIAPGDSPGILATQTLAPTSLTSFAFQFTGTGAPLWSNAAASVNDVLRLTDASNPFANSLTSSNLVDVFFDVPTLTLGTTFQGGFYTDKSADFTSNIAAATYHYYVRGDGLGTDATYGGQGYYALPAWAAVNMPSYTNVLVSTRYAQADFAGGTVDGFTSEFVVVPEPAIPLAGVLGLAAAAWCLRRRASAA
ncbi:MAG: autotransporter-associated beta strand repeat-containing protein [Planctomycetota bacterium]